MDVRQRHSYGEALIKAAQQFVRPRFSFAVVPMINQNNEVKRRVSMIVQFKPTPRVASIVAIVLVAFLACITFTSRAQKAKPPQESPTTGPQAESEQQSINALRQAYDQLTRDVEERAKALEGIRHELSIPSQIAYADRYQPGPEAEAVRRVEALRSEARTEFLGHRSLYAALKGMPQKEFDNSAFIAIPDAQFGALQQRQAEVEQQLAALSETRTKDHPEIMSLQRTLETIHRQLDDRRAGIREGLKVKVDSLEAKLEALDQELRELRQRDIEGPTRYREYFTRKRELENLQQVRDRLQMRIIDEEINAALPASSPPSIKPGVPAAKP
jgi:vacuolar-type H+-ATPase subunit I/STV1